MLKALETFTRSFFIAFLFLDFSFGTNVIKHHGVNRVLLTRIRILPSEDFENLLTLSFKKRTGNNWKHTVGKRQPQRHKQVFIHQCL